MTEQSHFWRATLLAVLLAVAFVAGSADAAQATGVWWGLNAGSWPTNLPPEGTGKVVFSAQNRGYDDMEGASSPIRLEVALPAGLQIASAHGKSEIEGVAGEEPGNGANRGPVTCQASTSHAALCTFEGTLPPGDEIEIRVAVDVAATASSEEEDSLDVSGGDAPAASIARPLAVGESTGFGVEDFQMLPEEEGGRPSTQAGAHPFQLTTVLAFDVGEAADDVDDQEPAAMAKDLTFQLPAGLVGNPTPFAQCTDAQFSTPNAEKNGDECAPQTAIGLVTVTYGGRGFNTVTVPLFNLTPLVGEPARFGFEVAGTRTTLTTSLRTGEDYGVTVHAENISETVGAVVSKVTFWGVPGDPAHARERGWACVEELPSCAPPSEVEPAPFLSMPTTCQGAPAATVQADSWAEPLPEYPQAAPLFATYDMEPLDGCNHLQFEPQLSVRPDVPEASAATGLEVKLRIPQTSALNPSGLAESALRELTLQLPEGVAVNAAGAGGLQACSEAQIGYLPLSSTPDEPRFSPTAPNCPNASKIGEVEIETPLLPHALKGSVYLASPAPFGELGTNPFDSLIALYVAAKDPVSGTLIKLPVQVSLDPLSGRLTATSAGIPDLPFETLRLHMFGEDRAPLGTPALCGDYTTVASFVPWSGQISNQAASSFSLTSGPHGGPCADPPPFHPTLTVQTTSVQAGGFSPLTETIGREDGEQNLRGLTLQIPGGVSAVLTGVPLCGEAQANSGTCPSASQIGETIASVGLGGDPYTVTGGKVYLTGPYAGAPFGVSVVEPAEAGPFDLGDIVIRGKIEVNPRTAALTFTIDPTGPYAIPTLIKGIPLQIRHVYVDINRPDFTFNPTDCNPAEIEGTLVSAEGASVNMTVPFQVTNCAQLAFAPKFSASTSGKTSRLGGASLHVELTYPQSTPGTQANIAKVKVSLPKQLPSRLKTLQKACPAGVFASNPADCSPASVVGRARAITPILPVPLEGPAYFVSHGGEAFPSLVVVLQGYGVKVELVGATSISKRGITSSVFSAVPDVPVGSFELTLPQGEYSALAANGALCRKKLAMPTEFVAQDGTTIHRSTGITVTGCHTTKRRQHVKRSAWRKTRPGDGPAHRTASAQRRSGARR